MKTTTITCDDCAATIEQQLMLGNEWAMTLKIGGRYTAARIVLESGCHLCAGCWPKIRVEISGEKEK